MAFLDVGDPCGVPCPKCGEEVVYNGNYFCPSDDRHWFAPENWIQKHPEAYANLMEWRARRKMIDVTELQNFNQDLYDRGAL